MQACGFSRSRSAIQTNTQIEGVREAPPTEDENYIYTDVNGISRDGRKMIIID